jgi:hypothetical protein
MQNRSSRSGVVRRAFVVALLACLSACTFLQNELMPLDAAPQRVAAPAVAVEGP